jgi:hypothetical protein
MFSIICLVLFVSFGVGLLFFAKKPELPTQHRFLARSSGFGSVFFGFLYF